MRNLFVACFLVLLLPFLFTQAEVVDLGAPPTTCENGAIESCPLAPYDNELVLQNQVFCPIPNTATGLELQGSGCDSLSYCCSTFDRFARSSSTFNVVGVSYTIDEQTGDIIVPSGLSVRLEFSSLACVARATLSTSGAPTQGSARITRYYASVGGQLPATSDAPLSNDGSPSVVSVDECRIGAISFQAPTDAALTIQSVSICLLNSQLDSCGVCGGDGSSCAGAAAASVQSQSGAQLLESCFATPPEPIQPTIFCHRRSGDECCTVFGYENPNDFPVRIWAGSEDNFFVPSPTYRGQPCFFCSSEEAAFSVYWNCTEHRHIHLKWQLNTLTTENIKDIEDENGEWPIGIQVHRDHKAGCPSNWCRFEIG